MKTKFMMLKKQSYYCDVSFVSPKFDPPGILEYIYIYCVRERERIYKLVIFVKSLGYRGRNHILA